MPGSTTDHRVQRPLREALVPLAAPGDEDRVLAWIGDASIVLLGEATHGTADFYALRARLTRRLVDERGFSAVAIEGDWPDASQVNHYIQADQPAAASATEALGGFARFPTWMWRNTIIAELVEWLRRHNQTHAGPRRRTGFHGLDLYSLHASMRAVIEYLETRDPAAARAARASYSCFEQFGPEGDDYAWAAGKLGEGTCEDAVTKQLLELHRRRQDLVQRDGWLAAEEFFSAEQNARLARNAERYYRTMFHGRVASWNVRDAHMAETLDELRNHLRRRGQPPKVVVWAHNSHLGDARATEMGDDGEWNVGQLMRERHGAAVKSIGFTTYTGSVIAASDWGGAAERKRVRPALPGSYEALLHDTGVPQFFLPLDGESAAAEVLAERRLERAIGVIYRPETERHSHYFHATLPQQFDAIIHVDESHALAPLDPLGFQPDVPEVPETYPTGI